MSVKDIKSILVIFNGNINSISVGSNYIKSYLDTLDNYTYECYEIKSSVDVFWGSLKSLKRTGSFPLISDFLLLYWVTFHSDKILKNIIKSLESKKISSIWFFANSLESVLIGRKLSFELEKLEIKFNVSVWDSIEHIANSKRILKFTKNKIFSSYRQLLNNANHITCISDGMKNHLDSQYGSDESSILMKSIVLPFPITSNLDKQNSVFESLANSTSVDIVFIGSTYCWKEWNSFIKALDSINWVLNKKNIFLHVYGKANVRSYLYKERDEIIYYKPMEHDTLIREISKYDFAYLPYFFDENKRIVAKTSLPGKLSAYIQSELPVIFHGPDYSSAASVVKKYNVGVVLNNIDNIDFFDLFNKLETVDKSNFSDCINSFYSSKNYFKKITEIM